MRDSHEDTIDRAGFLAIFAIVVGAGVVKALQCTYKKRMWQVRHDVQRVHLQTSLQTLGRDEIVRDEAVVVCHGVTVRVAVRVAVYEEVFAVACGACHHGCALLKGRGTHEI